MDNTNPVNENHNWFSGWEVVRTAWKEAWKNFLDDGNVLYIDWNADYMGVHIIKTNQTVFPWNCIFHTEQIFENILGDISPENWYILPEKGCLLESVSHTKF